MIHAEYFPLRLRYAYNSLFLFQDEDGLYQEGAAKGVRFEMPPTTDFYGCGERAININRRGQRLESYNQAHYCYGDETENLNITIPFVLSSDNWGVLFDGNYPGIFDFGATDPGVFDYQVEDGDFSYYLITGSDMRHVMQKYVTLTGKAPLPPLWALGYIQSRYGYESETQARSVVTSFRAMQIPLDALVLDLYWFGWGQMGDFDWDFSAFPTPQSMIVDFAAQG
ncbi:glycosyl hydrolase, partial [bacterium]|nr:glycosyl hydrolase [bacterium]